MNHFETLETQNTSILLVDDNPNNLVVLEAVLGNQGLNFVTATSGLEAISLVEKMDFALILLDVQMPVLDGYQTAKKIKSLDKGRDIPIIFITATYRDDPHIRLGYDAGAIEFFGKPFDPEILKAKIKIYVDLYQKTHSLFEKEKALIRAEAQLDSERKLKEILAGLHEGVIIADKNGKITHINDEANRIWGGAKFVDLHQYDDFVEWNSFSGHGFQEVLILGENVHREMINIQAFDGTQKTILYSSTPLRCKEGGIEGAVVIFQDITLEKNFENDLAEVILNSNTKRKLPSYELE